MSQGPVINWVAEVEKRRDELLRTTQEFLQIKSVLDPETAGEGAPFGSGIAQALAFALRVCEAAGMQTKNFAGYAGHAEFGSGDELIGVLSHVDVVPEGDEWSVPPYEARIADGKLIARGAIDDKGPAMASIFAAKIVKELGLPLGKRIRLIFGTDEETQWRCMDRYFETEEMPTMGFTPDADFPIIYAEKGVTDLLFLQTAETVRAGSEREPAGDAKLLRFESGLRVNMVPDKAVATLQSRGLGAEEIVARYQRYLKESGLLGSAEANGQQVSLVMRGKSAHGSLPFHGVNAATELTHFLASLQLDGRGARFARFTDTYFHRDHYGNNLGIAVDNDEVGPLTVNIGVIRYEAEGDLQYLANIRYPHSAPFEEWESRLKQKLEGAALGLVVKENRAPHRVDPSHPLVQTLAQVYTQQTGEQAELLAIGGATYARALRVGVAFGPLFPDRQDTAHQRDEHIRVDDLLRATALYAEAMYELAKT